MQYQGQIQDGQMHGKGKLTYESSEYYDGDWVKGWLIVLQLNSTPINVSSKNDSFRESQARDMERANTFTMTARNTLAIGRTTRSTAKELAGIPMATGNSNNHVVALKSRRSEVLMTVTCYDTQVHG